MNLPPLTLVPGPGAGTDVTILGLAESAGVPVVVGAPDSLAAEFARGFGGTIEAQTVMLLNSLRSIWDPQGKWADKEFRRYPESFPDVRLVGSNKDDSPLIGIELKGWYLLSKESEPSLRYKASADAVTEWDLICCVPWGLSNVLSGKPVVYEPYVEQAKFLAAQQFRQ